MKRRQTILIDQEVCGEEIGGVIQSTRRVAACAVLSNPYTGAGPLESHEPLAEVSFEVGAVLTGRALGALEGIEPCGYGKAALVGTAGDLEHGAAMIHMRIGLAMRRALGRGLALIPGNAKVGPAGAPIDVIFGGIDEGWDYDAMDTMTVVVPGAPKPDEILLIVAFLAGGRPNARIEGASQAQVEGLVRELRTGPQGT